MEHTAKIKQLDLIVHFSYHAIAKTCQTHTFGGELWWVGVIIVGLMCDSKKKVFVCQVLHFCHLGEFSSWVKQTYRAELERVKIDPTVHTSTITPT